MIPAFVGMLIGAILGTVYGGPPGGALGVVLGGMLGMLWTSGSDAVEHAPADARLVSERQRLLCIPKGQVAEAWFLRDVDNGRWLDVERCSLCSPEEQVGCRKRCLLLMRDSLPARSHPVAVGA